MNRQDGSIQRFDSRAVKLKSLKDIRDIARNSFEREFSWFDARDPLTVEGDFPAVRVFYVCKRTTRLEQRTFVDCRFHFDSREMWIGSIEVAACHRRMGVGRRLVRAAEAAASALGIEEVRILPLPPSVEFWLKLDYVPDRRMAKVLWKNLVDVAESSTSRRASSLRRGRVSAQKV